MFKLIILLGTSLMVNSELENLTARLHAVAHIQNASPIRITNSEFCFKFLEPNETAYRRVAKEIERFNKISQQKVYIVSDFPNFCLASPNQTFSFWTPSIEITSGTLASAPARSISSPAVAIYGNGVEGPKEVLEDMQDRLWDSYVVANPKEFLRTKLPTSPDDFVILASLTGEEFSILQNRLGLTDSDIRDRSNYDMPLTSDVLQKLSYTDRPLIFDANGLAALKREIESRASDQEFASALARLNTLVGVAGARKLQLVLVPNL
jgi:hypothetical protein